MKKLAYIPTVDNSTTLYAYLSLIQETCEDNYQDFTEICDNLDIGKPSDFVYISDIAYNHVTPEDYSNSVVNNLFKNWQYMEALRLYEDSLNDYLGYFDISSQDNLMSIIGKCAESWIYETSHSFAPYVFIKVACEYLKDVIDIHEDDYLSDDKCEDIAWMIYRMVNKIDNGNLDYLSDDITEIKNSLP